jgi:hypothetical protein
MSARELTWAYLARQMLLRRATAGPVDALHRLVAVQAQYSPSPYLALAARLERFTIADLERCLRRGVIVKSTLMRGTLHLTTAARYPEIAAVVQSRSIRYWQRIWGETGVDADALARELSDYLAVPRAAEEIRAHVDAFTVGKLPARALLSSAKFLIPSVHVPPSGLWREHGAPGLVAWQLPLPSMTVAAERLVHGYLAGYGPATRADIANFTGLRKTDLDAALTCLEPLTRLADEEGRELLDLPRAPRPHDVATPAPPRLLPKWDSALLSHTDRRRILPEALRARVINPANGDVVTTYLLDGTIAGTWSADRDHDRVVVQLRPLRPGGDHGGHALEKEARRTAAFMEPDATKIDVELNTEEPVCLRAAYRGPAATTLHTRYLVGPTMRRLPEGPVQMVSEGPVLITVQSSFCCLSRWQCRLPPFSHSILCAMSDVTAGWSHPGVAQVAFLASIMCRSLRLGSCLDSVRPSSPGSVARRSIVTPRLAMNSRTPSPGWGAGSYGHLPGGPAPGGPVSGGVQGC